MATAGKAPASNHLSTVFSVLPFPRFETRGEWSGRERVEEKRGGLEDPWYSGHHSYPPYFLFHSNPLSYQTWSRKRRNRRDECLSINSYSPSTSHWPFHSPATRFFHVWWHVPEVKAVTTMVWKLSHLRAHSIFFFWNINFMAITSLHCCPSNLQCRKLPCNKQAPYHSVLFTWSGSLRSRGAFPGMQLRCWDWISASVCRSSVTPLLSELPRDPRVFLSR